tara:strand:+ start:96 stop:2024 length:1929 start_codon:yes stop_codon:yes gene_type:complete
MFSQLRNLSALSTSIIVHVTVLIVLWTIPIELLPAIPDVVVETFFDEEETQERFVKEIDEQTEISETQNVNAGGVVSTTIGGSGSVQVAQTNIETSESLKEPDIEVNVADVNLPGQEIIGNDLGVGEVNGEVGAVVEGYGAALSRITQELVRLMRERRVMAVWLFDESESMKDDQKEIATEFHKVYEELGIQQMQDEKIQKKGEVLMTSILGFGDRISVLTKEPTGDVKKIQQAIHRIGIDRTGNENMCRSIAAVLDQFGPIARKQKRQLVVIVVTDESPTDHVQVEQAIQRVKKAGAPIYILGREAIFGYPYARVRWVDPVYGLSHWVRIDRGPETAFPECLQYDGMHGRWDSFSSGFGPYSHVRLAKHSGGIFFMLPGEEENLSGAGAHESRRFAALAMKEYEPLLLARREYAQQVTARPFRVAISNIIATLNPNNYPLIPSHDPKLNIQQIHYSVEVMEFRRQAVEAGTRAFRAMGLLSQAIGILDKNAELREREESQRWRANFDLIRAQCYAYRVRLFQFLLHLDKHAAQFPKPKKPKSNRWHFGRDRKMITPDEGQYKRVQVQFKIKSKRESFLAEMKEQQKRATELFQIVLAEHPGTPWARRAEWELGQGYGMNIHEGFHDPRYRDVGKRIKIPKF